VMQDTHYPLYLAGLALPSLPDPHSVRVHPGKVCLVCLALLGWFAVETATHSADDSHWLVYVRNVTKDSKDPSRLIRR
jgi:hypothetical protein